MNVRMLSAVLCQGIRRVSFRCKEPGAVNKPLKIGICPGPSGECPLRNVGCQKCQGPRCYRFWIEGHQKYFCVLRCGMSSLPGDQEGGDNCKCFQKVLDSITDN